MLFWLLSLLVFIVLDLAAAFVVLFFYLVWVCCFAGLCCLFAFLGVCCRFLFLDVVGFICALCVVGFNGFWIDCILYTFDCWVFGFIAACCFGVLLVFLDLCFLVVWFKLNCCLCLRFASCCGVRWFCCGVLML